MLFSLIIGLRFYVGGDYPSYLDDFNNFVEFNISYSESRYSLGYYGLMYLLNTLSLTFPFLFISIAFLQIFFIYKWASLNKFLLPWIIYFYFSTLYLFESMNIMRQALAFSIILFSINYIYKSEKIKFILIILLASSFHKSAIFFLPFYFFITIDWIKNKYIRMLLLILSFIFSTIVFEEFFDKFVLFSILINQEGYARLNSDLFLEKSTTTYNFAVYFLLIIDIIIISYSDKLKKVFKQYKFISYFNLFFIGSILSSAISSTNSILLYRIGFYFTSFRIVILSFLCYYLFSISNTFLNKFLGLIIIFLFLLWFINAINSSAAWSSPFQFFWQDYIPIRK